MYRVAISLILALMCYFFISQFQVKGKPDTVYPSLEEDEDKWLLVVGDVVTTKEFGKVISPRENSYFLVEDNLLRKINIAMGKIGILGKLKFQKIGKPVDYLDIDRGTIEVDFPKLFSPTIQILPDGMESGVYALSKRKGSERGQEP